MLKSVSLNQFKRDYKRLAKRGKSERKLIAIIELLANEKSLPLKNRDHTLSGDYANRGECHVEPDWLLIYRKTTNELYLERTGTYADVF